MAPKIFQTFLQKLHVRRNYKDRFFLRCFQDKKDLLELYNSVAGSHYTNTDDLEITTLEDGIYMSMKNDISFIISWDMCLFEHQASYNPNMPLRGLFYFARLYEAYVEQNKLNIYGVKRLELPFPRFVVFYNGDKNMEDVSYLYLSDLYKNQGENAALWKDYPHTLECIAMMFNINYGHNEKLMNSCKRLRDYAYLMQMIKDNLTEEMEPKTAVRMAIDRCIEEDVMCDLLVKCRGEVFHMILTEYDEKKYKKMFYRDGMQQGESIGMERGIEIGAQITLINLVCTKLEKGKSISEIADALESDEEEIRQICQAAEYVTPRYSAQAIYDYLYKK